MAPTPSTSPASQTFMIAFLVVTMATALIDASRLILIMIPASFLVAAYGVGSAVERLLRPRFTLLPVNTTPVLFLTSCLGIGFSSVGLVTTVLGLMGLYRVAGLIVVAGLAWSLPDVARHRRIPPLMRPTSASLIGGLAIGIVWTVAWLWATIPPTFYDELAYHLPIPQSALRTGALPAYPWSFFTYMPYLSDLLLGWGLALGGEVGARAMHLAFWIAIWLAGWAFVERVMDGAVSPWTGTALAGVLSSSPTFLFLGTLTFAETALTFGVVASVALIAAPGLSQAWLAVGLVWGFVLSVKLSGLVWVAAAAVSALVLGWSLSSIVRASAIACLVALPWWGRAWWLTGNPFYPFGYRWLGGRYWDVASQARLQGDLPLAVNFSDPLALLRLPYDMVMAPGQFGSASECGILAVSGVCVLLSLPLWPIIGSLEQTARRRCYAAGLFILLAGMGWVMTSTTTRFFAPALVIGLCALSAFIVRIPNGYLAASLAVLLGLATWGTARFLSIHSLVFSAEQAALAREPGAAFASRTLDHYEAAAYVRERLPLHANLLFIGESRPFYFDRPSLSPYPFNSHPLAQWVMESVSPEDLGDTIRRAGFTHVVLNTGEFRRLQDRYGALAFTGSNAVLHEQRLKLLPRTLVTLYAKHGLFVFEIPSSHGS